MNTDLEKELLDELEYIADDDASTISNSVSTQHDDEPTPPIDKDIKALEDDDKMKASYIKKINLLKSKLAHIDSVKEFKIPNVDHLNGDQVKEIYNNLQASALCMNGFGVVPFVYSITSQLVEDQLCEQGINVQGATKALTVGPNAAQITTCLTLIDIDLFGDTSFVNSPYTALAFMTGMNFYGVYSLNKKVKQLESENSLLKVENSKLKTKQTQELQELSPPVERRKRDQINANIEVAV